MSVLQRKELEDSPLADLHAIASELGIEGYRGMRRDDLVAAIVDLQGGDGGDDDSAKEERPRRGRRGGRGRRRRTEPESEAEEDAEEDAEQERGEIEDEPEDEQPEGEVDDEPEDETEDETEDEPEAERAAGILDVLPNGSGFLRVDGGDDVYVSQAQIRRCELRPGDEVAGPVRPARRNERHPSLVRVETVNGADAEPPAERPSFDELTAVHPGDRLAAPKALADAPFGKGSRVAIAGPSGAGATALLREIAAELAGKVAAATVVLVAARPEEVAEWREAAGAAPVVGGSYDEPADDQTQAASLAVERGKRAAERGEDAVVVIDSLDSLAPGAARRLLGAGRKLAEGGSLTVVAAVGERAELLRVATTRVVLAPGGGVPRLDAERSGTQRADLL
ncbi:MAG: transcription termination factor Rho [Solirubrobacterales bacterium]|nr:transcription termination factor Rho [Solirubrobacterales bacterium]